VAAEEFAGPHWSLGLYLDYLRRLRAPSLPFDAEGAWEHTYDVFPIYGALDVTGKAWSAQHRGALRVKREPVPGTRQIRLDVFSEVTFLDLGTLPTKYQRTSAAIICRDDQLATPARWDLKSEAIGKEDGQARPLSALQETGSVEGGVVQRGPGARQLGLPDGGNVTSNWSLFDAVQRLPEDARPEFTMLEDLRLLRREQRLVPEAPVEVAFADRMVRLHGFRQTGEGILPLHWWQDELGRVLLVLGNVRAYIWHGEEG